MKRADHVASRAVFKLAALQPCVHAGYPASGTSPRFDLRFYK